MTTTACVWNGGSLTTKIATFPLAAAGSSEEFLGKVGAGQIYWATNSSEWDTNLREREGVNPQKVSFVVLRVLCG